MPEEIVDYDIVEGCPGEGDLEARCEREKCPCSCLLSERVKEKISQGWYPLGGVSVVNYKYDTLNMHKNIRILERSACQAMVKYKKENTK